MEKKASSFDETKKKEKKDETKSFILKISFVCCCFPRREKSAKEGDVIKRKRGRYKNKNKLIGEISFVLRRRKTQPWIFLLRTVIL